MSNIAIIPARAGSKGLIDKNIKKLDGKPLISYTIKAALDSGVFDKVIVSTDSEKYAEIALKYGAEVPFLRPDYLASDTATTAEVLLHLFEYETDSTDFVLLQPTSPFRTGYHIKNAFRQYVKNDKKPIISVNKVDFKVEIINTLESRKDMYDFMSTASSTLRQSYKDYYQLNGAIYISNIDNYKRNKSFFSIGSKPYIMESLESLDIDNEFDFWLAEKLLEDEMIIID